MDSVQRSEHDKKKYDKKCDRVARYFVKHLPDMKLGDAFSNFCNLDKPVKELIWNGDVVKQSPLIMLFPENKDILTHVIRCGLVHMAENNFISIDKEKLNKALGGNKILDFPYNDIMNMFNRCTSRSLCCVINNSGKFMPKINTITKLFPYSEQNTDSEQGVYNQNYEKKRYLFSVEEIIFMTSKQQELLELIVNGHVEGLGSLSKLSDPSKRYAVKKCDLDQLMTIKDLINENESLCLSQINVDCEPVKNWEKVTDTLAHSVPLFIVSSIIPEGIHGVIDGKLQGLAGMIPACLGGFFVGKYVYPVFDMGNSASRRASEWFGSSNKTKIERELVFPLLGFMHYMFACLANKCLDYSFAPLRVIGYSLHSIRGIVFVCNAFDLRSYCGEGLIGLFPKLFTLEKYNDVASRPSKYGKPYTLGDLLNGPMASDLWFDFKKNG